MFGLAKPSPPVPRKKKKYPAIAKIRTIQTALAIPAAFPGVISLFLKIDHVMTRARVATDFLPLGW